HDLRTAAARRDGDGPPAAPVAVALVNERVAAVDVEEEPVQLALQRGGAGARDRAAGIARRFFEKAAAVAEDDRVDDRLRVADAPQRFLLGGHAVAIAAVGDDDRVGPLARRD